MEMIVAEKAHLHPLFEGFIDKVLNLYKLKRPKAELITNDTLTSERSGTYVSIYKKDQTEDLLMTHKNALYMFHIEIRVKFEEGTANVISVGHHSGNIKKSKSLIAIYLPYQSSTDKYSFDDYLNGSRYGDVKELSVTAIRDLLTAIDFFIAN